MQVRLALLAHVVRRALAAADHERDLGLLAAQARERLRDLGALGRARRVGQDRLVQDARDAAHAGMVAQAAAIMRRRTSGRMPPCRRYSASAGVSTRASTSKLRLAGRRLRRASTVRRWCGSTPPAMPWIVKRSRPSRPSDAAVWPSTYSQRQHAHAHEVRAVDALVALGDDGADAEQQRALRRPVARRAGAVLLAHERDERDALGAIALGRVEDRDRLAGGEVRGVAALAAVGQRVAQADVAERAAHHHLVVAAARAERVEVARLDAVLDQVAAGGHVARDRAGRGDVVGRDRVAEHDEAAGVVDVGHAAPARAARSWKNDGSRT